MEVIADFAKVVAGGAYALAAVNLGLRPERSGISWRGKFDSLMTSTSIVATNSESYADWSRELWIKLILYE